MKLNVLSAVFILLQIGVFLSLSTLMIRNTNLLESEARDLDKAFRSVSTAQSIKSHVLAYNRNELLSALGKDTVPSKNDAYHREIENLIEISEQLVADEEERVAFQEMKERVAVYFGDRARLRSSLNDLVNRQQVYIGNEVDAAINSIGNLISVNEAHMEKLLASTEQINKATIRWAVILLLVGGLIAIALLLMVIFEVVAPLLTLSKVILKYDTGNGSVRAPIKGVSEIRSLSNNFNLMCDRLNEKRQDQFRFIAAIAHDLRNPLNSMSMASELLISEGSEKDQKFSKIIFRQVKNLDRLIGDLLDITRIEAGQLVIETSEHDLNCIIKEAIELYRSGDHIHAFKVDLPKEPLLCKCDHGRISQVINNLISNAIKYSPNGGTITLKARKTTNQIVVSVADQGMGIDKQDLVNIFKPFHRTKATKETIPGIGLGLSTCRSIVEAHNGTLKVESQLGSGSTFCFTLPTQLEPQS